MPTATSSAADTRSSQLLWYAAAATGVLGLTAAPAEAQIVYMDVEPDLVVEDTDTGGDGVITGIDFDLNDDGDNEIVWAERIGGAYTFFGFNDADGPGTITGILGSLVLYGGYNYIYPNVLPTGATISGGAFSFIAAGTAYGQATFTFGGSDPLNWLGQDGYFGFQFTPDGTNLHYGWIRVEIPAAGGQIIVKEAAFNATPDAAIMAGDMGSVAIEPGADGLPGTHALSAVFPNPFNPQARFTLEVAEQQHVRVALVNALGQQVATLHDGALAAGTVHAFAIDGAALPSGVYLVRAVGERFADVQQVTLTK